ncbi:MAG: class I SAM-dependent rRNA methyltransferase [Planctomycetota bacterium]
MGNQKLIVNKAGWKRLSKGHPWVFSDDLADTPEMGKGEIVALHDSFGKFLGRGFYNPQSRIAFRLITRRDEPLTRDYWKNKLEIAIQYRDALDLDGTARRIIYSEADGFPGLIVDQYNDCLCLQILSLGMESLRNMLIDLLREAFSPSAMVARNDAPVRKLEGLSEEKGVIYGHLPEELMVRERDLLFHVNLLEGQKTGAYLDQRDNHLFLRSYAEGRRVLDAFCYDGGFALHLMKAGAREVVAIDSSRLALEHVASNALLNNLGTIETRKSNCFDALKAMARDGERFDLIVVDPPPFARRKSDLSSALRAYKEINLRAIQCLNPGGLLFTCCCSHGVSHDLFSSTIAEAAGRARRDLILLEERLQPPDHPILFNEPESLYLKGLLFRCL